MEIKTRDYYIGDKSYSWDDIESLLPIANCDINRLCKENSQLLVFPKILGEHYGDGLDEEGKTICSIYPNEYNENKKPLRGKLETWDLLGFVGCNDTELTIHSRFAENDRHDLFMHYMVHKVFNINLFDLKHSSGEGRVFDFLMYFFPHCLKEALRQGMYKQYVVNKYNDSHVRGMIDVARHIKNNIPFAGKIAYNVREYSYDNSVTQLIRHTIEYIRTTPLAGILKTDDTESYVSQICEATPSYKMQDRGKIISKNLKSPTHPYYLKYIDLQKLCIKILTHQKLQYEENKDKKQIYGLLFSGSWLWEEYLYHAVLKFCGFTHPENKTGKGAIHLFTNGSYKRFPDYYKDGFVLDAKYKPLNNNGDLIKEKGWEGSIDRNDMHQVITYMYILESPHGGFIHPFQAKEGETIISHHHIGTLNKYVSKEGGGKMHVISVPIPIPSSKDNYMDFSKTMGQIESNLRKSLEEIAYLP